MIKKYLLALFSLAVFSCNNTSSSDTESFEGKRYETQYSRWDYDEAFVPVKGTQEFWFFKSGIFRQIGDNYVESHYGDSQACSGTATGTFVITSKNDNVYKVNLTYEGIDIKNIKGLCRMTDREVIITVQPSGAVDMLDTQRVQRLNKIEDI